MPNVDIEFDRDGNDIVLSARSPDGTHFTLQMPYAGAAALAAAANRAVDNERRYSCSRFTLPTAELEVSHAKSPTVQHR
jgi:hypothetical protein